MEKRAEIEIGRKNEDQISPENGVAHRNLIWSWDHP